MDSQHENITPRHYREAGYKNSFKSEHKGNLNY